LTTSADRQREQAPRFTIEALVYELRTLGLAALAGNNCRRRLAELSTKQLREVIARLINIRPRYPAVTDELLLQLGDQL
jgi:hypothetical protein